MFCWYSTRDSQASVHFTSIWTEAWDSHKLQVPVLSYNWWGFHALDTLQDSTDKQQHWQSWNQFVMTGVFLSVPRYNWWAPLSHPSSCMLVNCGPSQWSFKEDYKPWKWGATTRYYASHTKTVLPTRQYVPRSSRQLDHTKTSWPS